MSLTMFGYYVSIPIVPYVGTIVGNRNDAYELGQTLNKLFENSLLQPSSAQTSVHDINQLYNNSSTNHSILNENYEIIYQEYVNYIDLVIGAGDNNGKDDDVDGSCNENDNDNNGDETCSTTTTASTTTTTTTKRQLLNKNKKLPTFDQLDPGQRYVSKGEWEVLWIQLYNQPTCLVEYFPKTLQLIKQSQLPAVGIMISKLKAHQSLPIHVGPTNAVLRYHLGLKVPILLEEEEGGEQKQRPYLQVWDAKEEGTGRLTQRTPTQRLYWKEGSSILFDDTYYHSATNPTNEDRIVLWLDLKRTTTTWSSGSTGGGEMKGWRELFWANVIYKVIEVLNPPEIATTVSRTSTPIFCPHLLQK